MAWRWLGGGGGIQSILGLLVSFVVDVDLILLEADHIPKEGNCEQLCTTCVVAIT